MEAAQLLDDEFLQYWSKLNVMEKESLLTVARTYILLKEESGNLTDLRKNIIREERENYLQGKGKSYSWEEVKDMALNKEKRHVL